MDWEFAAQLAWASRACELRTAGFPEEEIREAWKQLTGNAHLGKTLPEDADKRTRILAKFSDLFGRHSAVGEDIKKLRWYAEIDAVYRGLIDRIDILTIHPGQPRSVSAVFQVTQRFKGDFQRLLDRSVSICQDDGQPEPPANPDPEDLSPEKTIGLVEEFLEKTYPRYTRVEQVINLLTDLFWVMDRHPQQFRHPFVFYVDEANRHFSSEK